MQRGEWAELAVAGAEFEVTVTPGSRRPGLSKENGLLRCAVSAPPQDGRANAAVAEMLARALGVAKTRLVLVRGAASRVKLYRLE